MTCINDSIAVQGNNLRSKKGSSSATSGDIISDYSEIKGGECLKMIDICE